MSSFCKFSLPNRRLFPSSAVYKSYYQHPNEQEITVSRTNLRHLKNATEYNTCNQTPPNHRLSVIIDLIEIHSRPQSSTVFFNCVSCSSGNGKSLNFLIGHLKMNAQQGTTFYPSAHNVFLPVEFQMLARVYQPVEI